MKIKKVLLKILPYSMSIFAGVLFYFVAINLNGNIKSLFTNISAVFFAIPLIYVFYQAVTSFSQRRLNKEIFDYAKLQIDSEILLIVYNLSEIIYGKYRSLPRGENEFFLNKRDNIKKAISKRKYKNKSIFSILFNLEKNLHEVVKNPYIIEKLENEQMICVLSIIKNLRYLRGINEFENFCVKKNNKFVINKEYLDEYSKIIFNLMDEINTWASLTGSKFFIDIDQIKYRESMMGK